MIQRWCILCLSVVAWLWAAMFAATAWAAIPNRAQIEVTHYTIHAELDPAQAKMTATVAVTFTALDDLDQVVFGLNNGLQITSLADTSNKALTPERNAVDSTVTVGLDTPMAKGASATWTFVYSGRPTAETSPVSGIDFAQVGDPISFLLYPGRWFPIALPGLYTNRFTAETHVVVPAGESVVGSGFTAEKPAADGGNEFVFNWTKPGFPGTIVVGKFLKPISPAGIPNIRIFVLDADKDKAQNIGFNVARSFEFMSNLFGPAESGKLDVVALPDSTVSAEWAPEVVAIKPSHASFRLVANTVAHQWWGSQVSPYTLNDAWITNGMCRYAELLAVEDSNGKAAFESAITDAEAAALAYDTDPLTTLRHIDPFSPEFQDMTYDKGAMVFHMLRWEMGDDVFTQFLHATLTQYADKSIRSSQIETVAEDTSHLNLTPFFSQWLDGTGAPEFTNNYSVFRLGGNKGFRTVGSVSQDLDLFSMPVELSIETEGKTVNRRVDLAGTQSNYSIETFGRPTRIVIDPDNWILKSTPDLEVKVAVLRGQQDVAQGDLTDAIAQYQQALSYDRGSSLANYRLAEVFMTQRNYQAAANSFRDALRGDDNPRWTEVWSHVNLGRIFDITGQRSRAVNEYRQAIQTNDNTQGAINEARYLIAHPYKVNSDED